MESKELLQLPLHIFISWIWLITKTAPRIQFLESIEHCGLLTKVWGSSSGLPPRWFSNSCSFAVHWLLLVDQSTCSTCWWHVGCILFTQIKFQKREFSKLKTRWTLTKDKSFIRMNQLWIMSLSSNLEMKNLRKPDITTFWAILQSRPWLFREVWVIWILGSRLYSIWEWPPTWG
jgi:hypothetical protein